MTTTRGTAGSPHDGDPGRADRTAPARWPDAAATVRPIAADPVPLRPLPGGPVPAEAVPTRRASRSGVLGYGGGPPLRRAGGANPLFAFPARDLWVPGGAVLAAVGLMVAVWVRGGGDGTVRGAALMIGAYGLVKAAATAVFVPLALWLLRVPFGRAAEAGPKLAAVAMLPDAVLFAGFTYPSFGAAIFVGPIGTFVVAWALFRYLFDLEWHEARWCVVLFAVIDFAPLLLWWHLYDAVLKFVS